MEKKYIFVLLTLILMFVLTACASKNKNSNNESLSGEDDDLMNMDGNKVIYLAGGCFWGTEKYLSLINGVVGTEVGYANGNTENPSYEDVCRRNTGH
ncbi:MAG: peptide-methionine (S)-S-oxide reductase, partial [Sedimentibacter sp.]|uniref:peptide-methionine (S)-S-oxide reductase n=1 Tax=Sedimentibacter sp. TaxID=1960295 RepID=UPI0029813249